MKSIIVMLLLEFLVATETSDKGKNFIKEHEGLKLESYECAAGQNTIGYGHANSMLRKISKKQADSLFAADIAEIEKEIVGYGFNQNQYDAVVSFIYNVGVYRFKTSTFAKTLDPEDMRKYVYAKGRKLKGLEKRRNEEINLFNSSISVSSRMQDTICTNY